VTPLTGAGIFLAGLAAGTINTIVGSGSLITFPTLLAAGYPSITANVSNTLGLVPGSLSGAIGYREELYGQRSRLVRLAGASASGAVLGAVLLLTLPSEVFDSVVPLLILLACALMALQPRLSKALAARRGDPPLHGGAGLLVSVFLTGVYGGYFGAAQGVILIALLATFLPDQMQRLNAAKNVLAMVANGVAALIFIGFADVAWGAAGLIALGATVGGQLGARLGRKLPTPVFRAAVVILGTIVAVKLLVSR
jgi:uncharacterized membrane protein YfcA